MRTRTNDKRVNYSYGRVPKLLDRLKCEYKVNNERIMN
jgi:hypothetical protein